MVTIGVITYSERTIFPRHVVIFFRFYTPREIYVFPNQMHVPPLKTILDGRQKIDLVTCWSHAGLRRFPPTIAKRF